MTSSPPSIPKATKCFSEKLAPSHQNRQQVTESLCGLLV